MKLVILLLILLALVQCKFSSENSSNTQLETNEKFIKPNLEGHWKLVRTNIVDTVPFIDYYIDKDKVWPISEGLPFEFVNVPDLVFNKDSVFRIDYPMELFDAGDFSLDTHYLRYTSKYGTNLMPISVEGDTMNLYLESEGVFLKETYLKTNFNDSIVSILTRDTLNYPLLEGTWILKRDYWYDYGTHYWLEFPYTIPDSIELTREEILETLHHDKSIKMKTNGKNRKYFLGYYNSYLQLKPGNWYKGDDPHIHFERRTTE